MLFRSTIFCKRCPLEEGTPEAEEKDDTDPEMEAESDVDDKEFGVTGGGP